MHGGAAQEQKRWGSTSLLTVEGWCCACWGAVLYYTLLAGVAATLLECFLYLTCTTSNIGAMPFPLLPSPCIPDLSEGKTSYVAQTCPAAS